MYVYIYIGPIFLHNPSVSQLCYAQQHFISYFQLFCHNFNYLSHNYIIFITLHNFINAINYILSCTNHLINFIKIMIYQSK